jgi:hypothetical protein
LIICVTNIFTKVHKIQGNGSQFQRSKSRRRRGKLKSGTNGFDDNRRGKGPIVGQTWPSSTASGKGKWEGGKWQKATKTTASTKETVQKTISLNNCVNINNQMSTMQKYQMIDIWCKFGDFISNPYCLCCVLQKHLAPLQKLTFISGPFHGIKKNISAILVFLPYYFMQKSIKLNLFFIRIEIFIIVYDSARVWFFFEISIKLLFFDKLSFQMEVEKTHIIVKGIAFL